MKRLPPFLRYHFQCRRLDGQALFGVLLEMVDLHRLFWRSSRTRQTMGGYVLLLSALLVVLPMVMDVGHKAQWLLGGLDVLSCLMVWGWLIGIERRIPKEWRSCRARQAPDREAVSRQYFKETLNRILPEHTPTRAARRL